MRTRLDQSLIDEVNQELIIARAKRGNLSFPLSEGRPLMEDLS
jgi:hypothetical protein